MRVLSFMQSGGAVRSEIETRTCWIWRLLGIGPRKSIRLSRSGVIWRRPDGGWSQFESLALDGAYDAYLIEEQFKNGLK